MKNEIKNKCNHTLRCLNPQCIGGRIQTTMKGDDGYSEWTVLEYGCIEFKCHGCGKFASTDKEKQPNEMDNFEIKCKKCGSLECGFHIEEIENPEKGTYIFCKKCKIKSYKIYLWYTNIMSLTKQKKANKKTYIWDLNNLKRLAQRVKKNEEETNKEKLREYLRKSQ